MSEKKKKNTPQEEQPQADTAPETEQAAEKAAEEETFTVTREQMEQMEQLAKMVSDASDKYLRLAAEYDNYRKRTTKEKENVYADAKADTVKEFLGVLDNLERGLAHVVASDAHSVGRRNPDLSQVRDVIGQDLSWQYAEVLLEENPWRIFRNEKIVPARA